MVVSTSTYEVTGEQSAPEDFKIYLYGMLRDNTKLHITARRTDIDDLAARRGDTTDIEFEFLVREIYYYGDDLAVNGLMYTDGQKGSWILMEVTDRVRFDIIG